MLQQVMDKLQNLDEFQQLLREVETNPTTIWGLSGSAKSLVIAYLHQHDKWPEKSLLITRNLTQSENLYEDLRLFLPDDQVFLFKDYEILPYEHNSPHFTVASSRIQALQALLADGPAIIVSSFRAASQLIPPKTHFAQLSVSMAIEQEYAIPELLTHLTELGYKRVSMITGPGEISLRGGILDIYSPQWETPKRFEFFGDELESIRSFDIESQISIQETFEALTILPMREFFIEDLENLPEFFRHKIKEKLFFKGVEQFIPFFFSELHTLLDYCPENTAFFLDEPQRFEDIAQELQLEAAELYTQALKRKEIPRQWLTDPQKVYLPYTKFKEQCREFHRVYLRTGAPELENDFALKVQPQMSFNSNLALFRETLSRLKRTNWDIYVLSDNEGQQNRLKELIEPLDPTHFKFRIGTLHRGFLMSQSRIAFFNNHEIFARYQRRRHIPRYQKKDALSDFSSLKTGDFVVHINQGIGVYGGIDTIHAGGNEVDCVVLHYANGDKLYVPTYQLNLLQKYEGDGPPPTVDRLGGKQWENTKKKAKKKIADIADELVRIYAARDRAKGIAFSDDTHWQHELETGFLYEETPDQLTAIDEVKKDMETPQPMERLLCGDVGFGKTEVAIRAAFKAVQDGYQVGILAPTTILAQQHYNSFRERIADFPLNIEVISRFRSPQQQKKILEKTALGEIDILIGTHRLLSKDVTFKNLGFLVIDEEQRFGVLQKEKLKQKHRHIDILSMSATPIPRTLYLSLSGIRDMSIMNTAPRARLPVRTEVVTFKDDIIYEAVTREIDRNGQVFFVHNRVQTIGGVFQHLEKLFPHLRLAVAHGQMPEHQLEKVVLDFMNGEIDMLISTMIIENGLDVPNANTIIINRADMFGLSQLYQLRGRVGRSNRRAYAYLMIPPNARLSHEAKHRLSAIEEYDELGSGFKIAMRDLEIRGAGNVLGAEQSGVINSIGLEMYSHLIKQAIAAIKEGKSIEEAWESEKEETFVDTDIDCYIPNAYIRDDNLRLDLYRRMNQCDQPESLEKIRTEVADRFGAIPDEMEIVFHFFEVNLLAKKLQIQQVFMRKNQLQLQFPQGEALNPHQLKSLMKLVNPICEFKTIPNLHLHLDFVKNKIDNPKSKFSFTKKILQAMLA